LTGKRQEGAARKKRINKENIKLLKTLKIEKKREKQRKIKKNGDFIYFLTFFELANFIDFI